MGWAGGTAPPPAGAQQRGPCGRPTPCPGPHHCRSLSLALFPWVSGLRALSTGVSEPGCVWGPQVCPLGQAGSGAHRCVGKPGRVWGPQVWENSCFLSVRARCAQLCFLTWRQRTQSDAVACSRLLLLNRYKLLVLEILALPLLVKPLQLMIICSLESTRAEQQRRPEAPWLLPRRLGVLGLPGSHVPRHWRSRI